MFLKSACRETNLNWSVKVTSRFRVFLFSFTFLGDGNVTGKFELVYDESEENADNMEEDPEVGVTLVFSRRIYRLQSISLSS